MIMLCRHTVDHLLDYEEGTLSQPLRAALERHLAECPRCVEFLRSYRETPHIVRRATAAELPPEVSGRVWARLAAAWEVGRSRR